MPDSDTITDFLLALYGLLFIGGCTVATVSPVVSPLALISIILIAVSLKKLKKLFLFSVICLITTCTIIAMPLYDFSEVGWGITLLIPALGIGFITRTKNLRPIWLSAIRVLFEPIIASVIFGYIVLGFVIMFYGLLPALIGSGGVNSLNASKAVLFIVVLSVYILGGFLVIALPASLTRVCLDIYTIIVRYIRYKTIDEVPEPEIRIRMSFHDLYVRFLVWLGAAPPSGYEHLLSEEEDIRT
jgi:hypothetical protein